MACRGWQTFSELWTFSSLAVARAGGGAQVYQRNAGAEPRRRVEASLLALWSGRACIEISALRTKRDACWQDGFHVGYHLPACSKQLMWLLFSNFQWQRRHKQSADKSLRKRRIFKETRARELRTMQAMSQRKKRDSKFVESFWNFVIRQIHLNPTIPASSRALSSCGRAWRRTTDAYLPVQLRRCQWTDTFLSKSQLKRKSRQLA
jgi:hypothetical protein